jgi:hypothetical protein
MSKTFDETTRASILVDALDLIITPLFHIVNAVRAEIGC